MLQALLESLSAQWGPFRLLTSYSILAALAASLAAVLSFVLLPKLWGYLPQDRGRAFSVDADKSVGKPVSAGIILVGIFAVVALLVVPARNQIVGFLPLMALASFIGFLDDRKEGGLSELALGIADLVISFAAAALILGFGQVQLWLPFAAGSLHVPAALALPAMTGVIWLSINAMNCSDGVDGLSANLAIISLFCLAGLLYVAVGNVEVAHYLRIPHNPVGADWSILAMTMTGCLFGYLWYNAPPSQILMGDAGSRPIGLLIGALVAASGNPAVLAICGSIILANGATGLAKVLLVRLFKIRILRNVRFPLHDHARQNLNWTGPQVLIRFGLLHSATTALLMLLLLKVR